jgi:hypothetical protein
MIRSFPSLSFAIQINISSPTRERVSPKAAGNTRSHVLETPTAVLRQILLQHHDLCSRLLEGDGAGHQAGNSHPVAPAKLEIVLEMEDVHTYIRKPRHLGGFATRTTSELVENRSQSAHSILLPTSKLSFFVGAGGGVEPPASWPRIMERPSLQQKSGGFEVE